MQWGLTITCDAKSQRFVVLLTCLLADLKIVKYAKSHSNCRTSFPSGIHLMFTMQKEFFQPTSAVLVASRRRTVLDVPVR